MRQFLKSRDISQFIVKVKVLSLAPRIWKLVPDSIRQVKTLSIFKIKLPRQPISIHVDFAKII